MTSTPIEGAPNCSCKAAGLGLESKAAHFKAASCEAASWKAVLLQAVRLQATSCTMHNARLQAQIGCAKTPTPLTRQPLQRRRLNICCREGEVQTFIFTNTCTLTNPSSTRRITRSSSPTDGPSMANVSSSRCAVVLSILRCGVTILDC
jgi:hypothetical protein